MNVLELIDKLQSCDSDLEVFFNDKKVNDMITQGDRQGELILITSLEDLVSNENNLEKSRCNGCGNSIIDKTGYGYCDYCI